MRSRRSIKRLHKIFQLEHINAFYILLADDKTEVFCWSPHNTATIGRQNKFLESQLKISIKSSFVSANDWYRGRLVIRT